MDYKEAASLLGRWDNILILTHKRPDGDTIGCAVGLCALLRQCGKTAWVVGDENAIDYLGCWMEGYVAPGDFTPDRVVAVDIASPGLLTPKGAAYLERGIDLAIDHHPSHEDFAAHNCVEGDKAACGEIIFKLVEELGALTPEIAGPLYLAVSTDTGCFVYPSTSPNTHRVAAALMETGIDYAAINKINFRTKSFKRLKLEGILASGMELLDGGETALVAIPRAVMEELGATERDTDNISAFAGQTEGVKNAITLREYDPGEWRVSVRTSGGLNASAVCAKFGGGGHAAASGGTVRGTLDQAKAIVLDAVRQVLHGT